MPTVMRTLWRDVAVLEYNGYRFPNTVRTQSLRVTPQYDTARRSVVYNLWSLGVRWYVAGLVTTDPEFNDLVQRLTHPAAPLRYEGRGLGNPRVNIANAKDVRWGPTPGPLTPHVLGDGRGLRLEWSVEWSMPNCLNGRHEFDLMELVTTVSHAPDDAGYVDRIITGHVAVPLTRPAANQKLKDSADEYRRSITPPRMKGYHRKFGPWVLSEDRTRLDFEIRDEELRGEQLPVNVVDAEFTESVSSSQMGLRQWQGSMSGRYRLRKGATGLDGARAFFGTFRSRLEEIKREVQRQNGGSSQQIIPTGFSASNPNRHGPPSADFTLSYIFTLEFKYLMSAMGLWTPVTGSPTWEAWVQSLQFTAFDPYTYTNLKFQPGDDRIVSLCGPQQSVLSSGGTSPPPPPPPSQGTQQTNTLSTNAYLLDQLDKAFPTPPAPQSWVSYECSVWVESDDGVIPARILPAKKLDKKSDFIGSQKDAVGRAIDALKLVTMSDAASLSTLAAAAQLENLQAAADAATFRRTEPELFVFLRGSAVRAGYEIEPPRLIEMGGVECVPAKRLDMGEGFAKGVRANGNAPLHFAAWNLRYYLPRMPAFIKAPPVPTAGFKAEGKP